MEVSHYGKNLVLYYSWSGNTRKIAKLIAQKTDADFWELQPEHTYPQNYSSVLAQVKRELQSKKYPTLRPIEVDWNAYDTIYLGTPNWWSSIAPPVSSFLHEAMPTNKTIAPFCTHGGGGEGHIAHDVRSYCIGCNVLPILSIQGNGGTRAEAQIERWLKHIES